MKIIKFGFFGEDIAHRIFIQNYLATFQESHTVDFQIDEIFCKRFYAENKKEVENRFSEVVQIGLSQFQQELFIVGRDMDTHDKIEFAKKFQDYQSKIWGQFQSKTCIFLPVQCIEHWLWYLKWRQENPTITKNVNFESSPNHKAKIAVYDRPKVPNKISRPIVESLTANLSIDFLVSRSDSFSHFNKQITDFLQKNLP